MGQDIRTIARAMAVLVFAVTVVGMLVTSALAKDREEYHGRRGYHGYHGHRVDHWHRYHRRGEHYYPGAVYGPPPPVVYAPPPSPPGISIVFPIHIR